MESSGNPRTPPGHSGAAAGGDGFASTGKQCRHLL